MEKKVIVVSPRVVTGGPEALHQLVDELQRAGVEASILYWPLVEGAQTAVPEFAHYQAIVCSLSEHQLANLREDSVVVIPETLADISNQFGRAKISLWWLSVDNFLHRLRPNRITSFLVALGWHEKQPFFSLFKFILRRKLGYVSLHMTQSYYASSFVARLGFTPFMLTDYVTLDTEISLKDRQISSLRESGLNIVSNGSKGIRLRRLFERRYPEFNIEPLRGLTKEQINRKMENADVYIDFGNQPGRDRMPREAALKGCVVFVNARGAASNKLDFVMSENFRFRAKRSSLHRLAGILRGASMSLEELFDSQRSFRETIALQRFDFSGEVRRLVQVMSSL